MADHVVDELHSYTAGHLSSPEVSRVEEHLRQCADCRKEADELDRLNESLMVSPGKVLEAVSGALAGTKRFEHLLPRVAALFDVSVEAARDMISRIDDPASWELELHPGVHACPVDGGPNAVDEGAFTVLLKVEPGALFPTHTHGGREQVLVLEGGYLDISGKEFWRGELDVRAEGTTHSFTALPGLGCLCAARTFPNVDGK